MGSSGGQRKRINGRGERARAIARALCELTGHTLADDAADLVFVDAERAEDVARHRGATPIIAVSGRRLRALEVESLMSSGASAVVDADANMLDVAIAASDLLFATYAQRRRYGRSNGGVPVRVNAGGRSDSGRLLDVGRSGAFVLVDDAVEDGTLVRLELELVDRPVALRGRVAFSSTESDSGREIAIEFALDDLEVAPKVVDLLADRAPLASPQLRAGLSARRRA